MSPIEQLTEVARTYSAREAEELGFVLSSVGIEPTIARSEDGHLIVAVRDDQLPRARRVVEEERAEAHARREAKKPPDDALSKLPKVPLYWLVALLVANLCVFIALEGRGGSENTQTLLELGASHAPSLRAGQWWRTITAVFVHIGALHLLGNSVTLIVFGAFTLREWGKGRFYAIYLLSGVIGNWLSFGMAGSAAIKAGASGAILGLLGGLTGDRIRARIAGEEQRYRVWHFIAMLVAYYGFAIGVSRRVDHWAHIGGLAAGLALALMLPRYSPDTKRGRTIDWALAAGVIGATALAWLLALL